MELKTNRKKTCAGRKKEKCKAIFCVAFYKETKEKKSEFLILCFFLMTWDNPSLFLLKCEQENSIMFKEDCEVNDADFQFSFFHLTESS